MSVREPAADGYRVLRMEYIRSRRIIDNDGLSKVTTNLGKILDIISLVVITTVPKQTVMDNVMDVQLIEKRITVLPPIISRCHGWITMCRRSATHLGDRGCEHDHFVQFTDPFHELIDSWSLDHVDVVILTFDFDRNSEVSSLEDLGRAISLHWGTEEKEWKTVLTLKLLCTRVSSRSRTRHFRFCR